ncbi:hypothetical protein B0F90DRAFT_1826368 [Multifurca ochricompacta]|uniref:Reverse transcriptase n=1 Tax=Multifurca ochricompacta TaxID=376703 RepID=A0AAD4LTF5_9AGAM|nr:hypothetical protein B0F90DRAFT_1826368 [Multifurca ochricompacta]
MASWELGANPLPEREQVTRAKFDTKMIRLKSDMLANDNSWNALAQMDPDGLITPGPSSSDGLPSVSDGVKAFAATFDRVCRVHAVKRTAHEFAEKLDRLEREGEYLGNKCTVTYAHHQMRLLSARKAFKRANASGNLDKAALPGKAECCVGICESCEGQVGCGSIRYRRHFAAMKEHYQDLLTYDPKGVSQDYAYWEDIDLGLPRRPDELTGLNLPITWREVLVTIRGMNRNTAPGKDGVHINVLKSMVLEECMRKLSLDNPNFKRPDFVRVDLPREELPYHPLTPMGNAFYTVLIRVWNSGVTPELWQEVHIINLFKGGDSENTNNYRGISLISCAYKVLLCLMANRLSVACEEFGLLAAEQGGFRPHEEVIGQR